MNRFISLSVLSLLVNLCFSQAIDVPKDTTTMPVLEIPEITIVGKKAITLPFARKGEIFDINIYEAPPADSSILDERYSMVPPIGSLPRYEEPLVPWHTSLQSSLGSFSTWKIKAYGDYVANHWGIYGNTQYGTTSGHIKNSSGRSYQLDVTAHSLVSTDNEILQSFRISSGMRFLRDSYGMFGIRNRLVNRSRTNFIFESNLNSLNKTVNVLDVGLKADIWSLTDSQNRID